MRFTGDYEKNIIHFVWSLYDILFVLERAVVYQNIYETSCIEIFLFKIFQWWEITLSKKRFAQRFDVDEP